MKRTGGLIGTIVLAGMLLFGAVSAPAGAAPDPESAAFGPHSSPLGVSYRQWAVRWSRWAFSTPTPQNALADPANCDLGQAGPAFFLPAGSGGAHTATCNVPAGQPIVVVPAGVVSTANTGGGDTAAELRADARSVADTVRRPTIVIDGQAGPDPARFRRQAVFTLTMPEDNLFGVAAGPTLAAVDVDLVVLQPLPVGQHEITLNARFVGDTTDYRLTLTVNVVS